MDQGTVNPRMKLEDQGITGLGYVYYNRTEADLQAAAIAAGEGVEGQGGAFLVTTASTQAGPRRISSLSGPHPSKTPSGGKTIRPWMLTSLMFSTRICWST